MSQSIHSHIYDRERVQRMLQDLLQATLDGMVVVNQDGEMIYFNSQTEATFGYGSEELVGRKVEMLVPERFRSHHAAYRADLFHRPTVRPKGAALDLYGRRKDGTEFPVEISFSYLETYEGPLVISAIRDVTLMLALRQSEERFRVALKASPVVVFNQDLNLRYTWINPPVLAWTTWPHCCGNRW